MASGPVIGSLVNAKISGGKTLIASEKSAKVKFLLLFPAKLVRLNLFLGQRDAEVEIVLFNTNHAFLLTFCLLFNQSDLEITWKSRILFNYLTVRANLIFDSFELILEELPRLNLIFPYHSEKDIWLCIVINEFYSWNGS